MGETFCSASVESKADGTFEFPAVPEGEWRISAQTASRKLFAVEWIEVARHDRENVKLHLIPPLTVRGKLVVEATNDAPPLKPGPLMLVLVGGRTRGNGDLLSLGGPMVNLDARSNSIALDIYPGLYRLGPQLQPPPPPYYLDAVRAGGADLTMQEVEISSDIAITVVYKSNGGSVRGTAENCASGGVVLVPADPALRRAGFSKSGPCDSTGRYEVRAVRPGDYYALAFAGNGPALALNEASSLLDEAVKVTVRAGEASLGRPAYGYQTRVLNPRTLRPANFYLKRKGACSWNDKHGSGWNRQAFASRGCRYRRAASAAKQRTHQRSRTAAGNRTDHGPAGRADSRALQCPAAPTTGLRVGHRGLQRIDPAVERDRIGPQIDSVAPLHRAGLLHVHRGELYGGAARNHHARVAHLDRFRQAPSDSGACRRILIDGIDGPDLYIRSSRNHGLRMDRVSDRGTQQ